MLYSISLERISLSEYQALLKKQTLVPSRQILWDDIDARFSAIKAQGIADLATLKKELAKPDKLAAFAEKSGVPAEYLNILRRQMGSLTAKSVKITEFPGLNSTLVENLQTQGFKTAKDVFESDQPLDKELTCLCDLTRINGVGAVAARLFYDAGFRSIEDMAQADAKDILEKITTVNAENQFYKATLGLKDMQFCIDAASLLIKYT
ncbi:MAG: DUF4332 domain-containing protein [Eubacteriales bacterium]